MWHGACPLSNFCPIFFFLIADSLMMGSRYPPLRDSETVVSGIVFYTEYFVSFFARYLCVLPRVLAPGQRQQEVQYNSSDSEEVQQQPQQRGTYNSSGKKGYYTTAAVTFFSVQRSTSMYYRPFVQEARLIAVQ